MRLTGFVTVNGVRVGLNWTITGNSVSAGPGLGADDVKVHIPLPEYVNSSGNIVEEVVPTPMETGGYNDWTVTDLRLELKQKGLPIYGNKQDLIDRLTESGATAPTEAVEEAPVAEESTEDVPTEEVSEDEGYTPSSE